jgi:hypothetical protein
MTTIELKELLKKMGLPTGFSRGEKLTFLLLIYVVGLALYCVNTMIGG